VVRSRGSRCREVSLTFVDQVADEGVFADAVDLIGGFAHLAWAEVADVEDRLHLPGMTMKAADRQ